MTFSVCPYQCKKVLFSISVLCLASFAPEHDPPVQAVLQITLFWYHIDLYPQLTACKCCLDFFDES